MRQERGPRLDMELVDGSGKGVGEEERAGMEDGLFWEEDGLLAHDCEFRSERAGLCLSALGIFGISRVCVCVTEDCQCCAK